jgi:hypothetical protein
MYVVCKYEPFQTYEWLVTKTNGSLTYKNVCGKIACVYPVEAFMTYVGLPLKGNVIVRLLGEWNKSPASSYTVTENRCRLLATTRKADELGHAHTYEYKNGCSGFLFEYVGSVRSRADNFSNPHRIPLFATRHYDLDAGSISVTTPD